MVTKRTAALLLAALASSVLVFAAVAEATMVGIYRNGMESLAQRSQLIKLSGRDCSRASVEGVLRVTVGKRTEACSLRTPVVGRNLELLATERLLSGTPKALQHKAYLGLQLRAGDGAKYEMRVFPLQRKVQLLRVTPERTKYLVIDKNEELVRGINEANALRLRATNVTEMGPTQGNVELRVFLGGTLVAEATDEAGGELKGRASAFVVGAPKNASGVIASVDDIVVRVPF